MELKKRLRPTMTNSNARYRGPTESLTHINMVNEAVHDLILLGKVLDGEGDYVGQDDYIRNNFTTYINGGEVQTSASTPSSSTLYMKKDPIMKNNVALQSFTDWTTYGGCTKTAVANGIKLTSTGAAKPSGITITLDVEPGDVILMRFGTVKQSGFGENHVISFGSSNINNGGSFCEYTLPLQGSIGYVDHVMECLYRETITLEINTLRNESELIGGVVDLLYPEVRYMKKQEVNMLALNTGIKSRVNLLQAEVKNLSQ